MTADEDFGDSLLTIQDFAARYPHLYANENTVRWLVRTREENGLTYYGAVLEVFNSGVRPTLYIHAPSWFEWMRAGGSKALPRRNP